MPPHMISVIKKSFDRLKATCYLRLSSKMSIGLDRFYSELVEFGRYQKFAVLLLTIPGCFMNAFTLSFVFALHTPDYRCKEHENDTDFARNSSISTKCGLMLNQSTTPSGCPFGWIYDTENFDSTIVTQWNLVCDHAIYLRVAMCVWAITGIVGAYLTSWLQDRFGRKFAFLWCTFFSIIGSLLTLLSPSFIVYAIISGLCGMISCGTWNVCYIWSIEYVGPNRRTLVSTIFCVAFAIGAILVGFIAMLCRSWSQLVLATNLPFLISFLLYWLVDESPRWLLTHGRTNELRKVLSKIVEWESKPKTALFEKYFEQLIIDAKENSEPDQKTGGYLDLVRGRRLRLKVLFVTICWFSNALVYITMAYNVENLGGNLFLAFILTSAVEAPANFLNLLILDRIGRIWPLCIAMIVSGICCLLTAPGDQWPSEAIIALAIVGKFCICSSFATAYQLGSELYPTVVRGVGIGFSTIVGCTAGIVMPYVLYSSETYRMLPMIIIGVFACVGGVCVLFLPETLDKPMPDTLEDAERIGRVGLSTLRSNLAMIGTGLKRRLVVKSDDVEETKSCKQSTDDAL